ncbi:MAG: DUF72 domain-containing protein [Calditerrivibrio sp.]|nr:DUF72 domain-containing protein [Calditerrivibrio sp.]MCA1931952.1 DUF72 domain-containing protein [Calditerrivibrio sp.]
MKINNKNIYLGTSGYKFDDWMGKFYPNSMKKQDLLNFYCNHFNFLELTYTYYKVPSYGEIKNIFDRTEGRCRISIKLPHIFLKGKYNIEDIKNFLIAVSPIIESDRFYGFLADFSYRFNGCKNNMEYLIKLKDTFKNYDLFIELINRTWYKERFLKEINDAQIGMVTLDLPDIQGLAPFYPIVYGGKSYFRLYGRSPLWLTPESKELNYNYEDKILVKIADTISELNDAEEVAVSFCNVVDAIAPKNALRFKNISSGKV